MANEICIETMVTDSINLASESSQRLVHIDLKGAPPKISYYEEFIPFVKRLGATGLLIEYEDMFPYEGEFAELSLSYAYSKDEIRRILELAKNNSLIIIPLIQTFGHLEFMLKHEKFVRFREVSRYPNSICPSHSESLDLVFKMLDQVMAMHKNCKWIHIGGDEVWQMGVCQKCKSKMAAENWTKDNLFLHYIVSLVRLIKFAYPNVRVIVWDDMMRNTSLSTLRESKIGEFTEPMVWHYVPLEDFRLDCSLFEKYGKVFPNLWVASAFKGATEMTQIVTPPRYHMLNQLAWVEVLHKCSALLGNVCGIAITGWQRFDHFTVLCELLPQAIPSLGLALQTILSGCLDEKGHHKVSTALGFTDLLPMDVFPMPVMITKRPRFPGSGIYLDCLALGSYAAEYQILMQHPSKKGGFTRYQVLHNRTNPLHIDQFLPKARLLLMNFEALLCSLQKQLNEVYYPETIDEWILTNVTPLLEELRNIVRNAEEQLASNGSSFL